MAQPLLGVFLVSSAIYMLLGIACFAIPTWFKSSRVRWTGLFWRSVGCEESRVGAKEMDMVVSVSVLLSVGTLWLWATDRVVEASPCAWRSSFAALNVAVLLFAWCLDTVCCPPPENYAAPALSTFPRDVLSFQTSHGIASLLAEVCLFFGEGLPSYWLAPAHLEARALCIWALAVFVFFLWANWCDAVWDRDFLALWRKNGFDDVGPYLFAPRALSAAAALFDLLVVKRPAVLDQGTTNVALVVFAVLAYAVLWLRANSRATDDTYYPFMRHLTTRTRWLLFFLASALVVLGVLAPLVLALERRATPLAGLSLLVGFDPTISSFEPRLLHDLRASLAFVLLFAAILERYPTGICARRSAHLIALVHMTLSA